MGKNNKPRKNRVSKSGKIVEVIAGSEYLTVVSATTNGTFVVSPVTFTRSAAIVDNFNLYRCTHLDVSFVMPTTDASVAVGFVPATVDNAPTSMNAVTNLEQSSLHFLGQTTITHLRLSRSQLMGESSLKWFKGIVGTPDAWDEQQGSVYFATSASTTLAVRIDYVFEFTGFLAGGNTPKPRPSLLPSEASVGIAGCPCASCRHLGGSVAGSPALSCRKTT